MSVLFVCGLLLVGVVLRTNLRPLRALFIPASVVGGLVGLAVIQAGLRVGPAPPPAPGSPYSQWSYDEWLSAQVNWEAGEPFFKSGATDPRTMPQPPAPLQTQRWTVRIRDILSGWPGLLIAVVFAGLLIERPGKRFSEAIVRAGRAGILAWIIIVGQIFLGLLVTALFIAPIYKVPPTFGQLIEVGWAGGFGSSTAMGQVYTAQGFTAGRDLGFLFATIGLLWGTLSGIFLVNLGMRRGWTSRARLSPPLPPGEGGSQGRVRAGDGESDLRVRPHPPAAPAPSPGGRGGAEATPIAFARIRAEIIDPFAFQLCLLAAAFAIGYAMQQIFLWLIGFVSDAQTMRFIGNIPLFLFTLLGGWTLRELMHVLRIGHLIDPPSINRLTGIAMEVLILAALATLRIDAAVAYLWPVLILLGLGAAWCVFCLVWLSPRLLPKDYWFELGLINYGMSTGTTAQGLMLLRIVDPDLETGAAEDYAAAAPLSAPFIGGGVLTVAGIPLALNAGGYWPVIAACGALIVGLYIVGRMLARADDARPERRGFEVIR